MTRRDAHRKIERWVMGERESEAGISMNERIRKKRVKDGQPENNDTSTICMK